MGGDAKSNVELLKETEELRKRIAWLEGRHSGSASETSATTMSAELLHRDYFHELCEAPPPIRMGHESTESIELKSLFTRDVSDVRQL